MTKLSKLLVYNYKLVFKRAIAVKQLFQAKFTQYSLQTYHDKSKDKKKRIFAFQNVHIMSFCKFILSY